MAMNRRTFATSLLAAGMTLSGPVAIAASPSVPRADNVVLVHGLFADGSSWLEVIPHLQARGLNVTSVQNPLTSLADAVAACIRVLNRQTGPTVLAGHSFSGMIVTEAGVYPNVSALTYVAARAPDANEDYTALAANYPSRPHRRASSPMATRAGSARRRSCATSPPTCRLRGQGPSMQLNGPSRSR